VRLRPWSRRLAFAPTPRARATAELRLEAERGAAALQADAAHEVQRIAALRDERVAQLLSEVIACVRHSGH
jgi:hypothetical protein